MAMSESEVGKGADQVCGELHTSIMADHVWLGNSRSLLYLARKQTVLRKRNIADVWIEHGSDVLRRPTNGICAV